MTRRIPEKIKRKLCQESGTACAMCGEKEVATHEFHHITPIAEGGETKEENLILLCSNCHSKTTYGEIEKSEILKAKKSLRKNNQSHTSRNIASNVINFSKISEIVNRGIIANKVNFSQNRKIKIAAPEGAIASSRVHRNYVKHLIDRYHEYKAIEVGKDSVKYPIIYSNIKRKFGAKWDMISLERFGDLSHYLQDKIGKTKFARIKKGQKLYSTFEEYIEKYD